ncbi:hypothetical protein MERGE_000188 [Pneumocystis wakefieldiae]|uniref:HECT domain-containing protein n=1 Tax=Pneumocystis wakefieldiae TaxID=38082 RepID=A0A899FTN1_9ASCO|nr:hypothetical protein MERGE_000188 [Pneumocystis wakefieldiae]
MQVVLKVTSILLKRIGRPLRKRSDILFLLITLENPFLFQHIYKDEPNNIIKRTFVTSNNQKTRFLLSEFYNAMVDYIDLVTEFDIWKRKLSNNNEMDLKKELRIEFIGENSVDIGGLRKECIMINVLEIFTWSEEVNYCWFNAASFESSDQYYLVAVIFGLAIYNSTILDVHLPLVCYKKLLGILCELDDLNAFRPGLVEGFQYLFQNNLSHSKEDFIIPEEMEFLIRGYPKSLDVDQLRAVAIYDSSSLSKINLEEITHCGSGLFLKKWNQLCREDCSYLLQDQIVFLLQMLLIFYLKFLLLETIAIDIPIAAHRCLNQLYLYCYKTLERLCNFLTSTIIDSEGFGLKSIYKH